MKTVEYMGSTYEVPDWANFIAQDFNGAVWVYSERPEWDGGRYNPSFGQWEKVKDAHFPQPLLKDI